MREVTEKTNTLIKQISGKEEEVFMKIHKIAAGSQNQYYKYGRMWVTLICRLLCEFCHVNKLYWSGSSTNTDSEPAWDLWLPSGSTSWPFRTRQWQQIHLLWKCYQMKISAGWEKDIPCDKCLSNMMLSTYAFTFVIKLQYVRFLFQEG